MRKAERVPRFLVPVGNTNTSSDAPGSKKSGFERTRVVKKPENPGRYPRASLLTIAILSSRFLKFCFYLIWIGPEEITKEAMKWRFNESVDRVDVTLALEFWRNSTVHT